MRIFSKGFNFSQDGPGNRLVYHLQGCNMHCIWCSNPEGMSMEGGKEYSVNELLSECISCRPMFFSGGGVTFTGGEATLWHDDLLQLLRLLGENGIHRAIETNGTSPRLLSLIPYIDYLIMDFKHYDSDILKKFTGVGNATVKENYQAICGTGRQMHIRIPLINGFNTDCPEKFAEYFSSFDTNNVVFELLLYHEYGKEKWKTEYLVKDGFVKKETASRFKKVFEEFGLKLVNT